jgi:hypothetical protein
MTFHAIPLTSIDLLRVMPDYSSDSDVDDDDRGFSDWDEDDAAPVLSLFDQQSFPTPAEALKHDAAVHGVDLVAVANALRD